MNNNAKGQDEQRILVIGGCGTALNIAEAVVDANKRYAHAQRFMGFLIDDPLLGTQINGFPILGRTSDAQKMAEEGFKLIFALYKPSEMAARVMLFRRLGITSDMLACFVHPSASVMPSAKLGAGVVVLPSAMVASNASIGMATIVNSSVVVEHDSRLGAHNFLAAGAVIGSSVTVGDGNFVGLNACIRENVVIGDYNFIGMGSVVLSDLPSHDLVYGCPAKSHQCNFGGSHACR